MEMVRRLVNVSLAELWITYIVDLIVDDDHDDDDDDCYWYYFIDLVLNVLFILLTLNFNH